MSEDNLQIQNGSFSNIISPRKNQKLLYKTVPSTSTPDSIIKKLACNDPKIKKVDFITQNSEIISDETRDISRVYSAELIKEYIEDCKIQHVKPLEELIEQLSQQEIIDYRLPFIDLKGIRLDLKTVESLEIIFMHVQANYLNFESTSLDVNACVSLCEIIMYYSNCFGISFGNNFRIGNRGWLALSQIVINNADLELLNLNRMVFTENNAFTLSKALRQSSSLKVIHLNNCYLNGERLRILLDGLALGQTIEEVYLAENKITSSDCAHIADFLRTSKSLRVLDLESNPIQDFGLQKIFTALVDSEVRRLESLQLWNTGITANSMKYIARYLSFEKFSNEPISLTSLNIGKNRIGDDGLLMLKDSLAQNKSVQRLGLASTRLSSVGIITLAEIIALNNKLVRIDLRDNTVNVAGLIGLSQALRHNTSMLKINFNVDFKVDEGMEQELNRVLDDIKERCDLNRKAINGHSDDIISTFSNFSNDSIARLGFMNNETSIISNIWSYISAPFRFTKNKLFGPKKIDIVLNAATTEVIPEISVEDVDNQQLPLNETENPRNIENLFTIKFSPTYNVSRFQVAKPSSHRRSRSENVLTNALKLQSNHFIKLTMSPSPLKVLNKIPNLEVNPPSKLFESSRTYPLKNQNTTRRNRSFSAEPFKKSSENVLSLVS